MTLAEILKEKDLSIYSLSKLSGVPYSTLNDICNGRTRIEKCTAETVYRIANAAGVSMEKLIEPAADHRCSFESFKSNVCHEVRELGDYTFIIKVLEDQEITVLYERQWYPESMYLLGMVDYLSRLNDIPLCREYDELRKYKLDKVLYPSSLKAQSAASGDDRVLREAVANAIPEFMRFNIVENEVRNVI